MTRKLAYQASMATDWIWHPTYSEGKKKMKKKDAELVCSSKSPKSNPLLMFFIP
jgi:hypothetical protein